MLDLIGNTHGTCIDTPIFNERFINHSEREVQKTASLLSSGLKAH